MPRLQPAEAWGWHCRLVQRNLSPSGTREAYGSDLKELPCQVSASLHTLW